MSFKISITVPGIRDIASGVNQVAKGTVNGACKAASLLSSKQRKANALNRKVQESVEVIKSAPDHVQAELLMSLLAAHERDRAVRA